MTYAAVAFVVVAIILFLFAVVIGGLDIYNTGTISDRNIVIMAVAIAIGIILIVIQQRKVS